MAVAIICFGVFVTSMYVTYTDVRMLWLITSAPTSDIGNLRPGFQKVQGRVRAASVALVSPFTRRKCIYYSHVIRRFNPGSRHEKWETVYSKTRSCHTVLDDGTGEVEINLADADVLATKRSYRPGDVGEFDENLSPELKKLVGNSPYFQHEEEVIEVGENSFAVCTVTTDRQGKAVLHKGENGTFIVSNKHDRRIKHDFNGRISTSAPVALFSFVIMIFCLWQSVLS